MTTVNPLRETARTTDERSMDAWHRLLRVSVITVAVTALCMQVAGRFFGPSFAILAVVCAVAAVLPARRRRTAAWIAGGFNLASLILHGGMTIVALIHPEVLLAAVLSVTNTVASIATIVAAIGLLRGASADSRGPGRLIMLAGALVGAFVVMSVVGYATRVSAVPSADETVLTHEGLGVSPVSVVVDGRTPTLVVDNTDGLYPRSFDIDALDVHAMIAPRTSARIELPSEPATYEFYDSLTMTSATSGTVEVR